MRVRIGFGLGTGGLADESRFGELVDALESGGWDSLWLSERLTGDTPDPLVGLAVAAGRTRRLKLGTSVLVVPGRNPAVLAKALASLDRLSGGRFLPAVGLGVADPVEQQAFGVARGERAGWLDEVLPLLRRLWTEDDVHHAGERFRFDGITIRPRPVQRPLDVWLGGRAPAELRRVGRLGDGWLPSFCTPDEVARGREVVDEAAASAGRAIDRGHFGALVMYRPDEATPVPDRLARVVAARRPDLDAAALVPGGLDAIRRTIDGFVAVGFTKFVLVPTVEPSSWPAALDVLAPALALQG